MLHKALRILYDFALVVVTVKPKEDSLQLVERTGADVVVRHDCEHAAPLSC